MASPTTTFNNTLQQNQHLLSSITLCKYPSFSFKSHYYLSHISNISSLKHPFPQCLRNPINSKFSSTEHKPHSTKTMKSPPVEEFGHGFSHLRSTNERVGRKASSSSAVEEKIERKFRKDGYVRKDVESRRNREMGEVGTEVSSLKSINKRVEMKVEKDKVSPLVDEEMVEIKKSRSSSQLGSGKKDRGSNKVKGDNQVGELKKSKKIKVDSPELQMRIGLDMCSKNGDFLGAVSLYDSVQRDNIQLGQYHYTVLLYLCSSAAVGIVRPAKSGSGSRNVDKVDFGSEISTVGDNFDGQVDAKAPHDEFLVNEGSQGVSVHNGCTPRGNSEDGFIEGRQGSSEQGECEIQVPEDLKRYALTRGFEIYEKMCSENIPLNEATLTSVARMAMSMGNGDMAFEMVKQMKDLGMKPRLRSYGPALFTYCNSGDIEKAFTVEEHMLANGIYPEEPELEALLRLSVRSGRGDKVYYLLHKLRTSLRQVSRSTADVIIVWFRSKEASRVGQRKWDLQLVTEAMKNGGGGWHGQGWLGKGKWTIAHALVGSDGVCENCGDKLVTIDLDPTETENFAKSVAAIAAKRERFSDFENFQKWLDYYGPFEAVVDAANVGLFSQRNFLPAKVNLIVNGIRQKLPSKKWPLIVLHNKRITGGKMIQPANRMLLEKWKNADALYATPTGSNDDWYWLYAAIKFKCLLVTNDEMRDHVFQLLGNDFFPRWKERHQVRFSFRDGSPEFHMPPPCSVVIQESSKGLWHIPIVSEHVSERERTWLCVTRGSAEKKDSSTSSKEGDPDNEDCAYEHSQFRRKMKLHGAGRMIQQTTRDPKDFFSNLSSILSQTVAHSHRTLLSDIEAAEKLGGCIIDFQI